MEFAHGKGAKYDEKEINTLFLGKSVIYSIDSMKFGDEAIKSPIYYKVDDHLAPFERLEQSDFEDLPELDNVGTIKMITVHRNKNMNDGHFMGSTLYIKKNNELLLLEGGHLFLLVKK